MFSIRNGPKLATMRDFGFYVFTFLDHFFMHNFTGCFLFQEEVNGEVGKSSVVNIGTGKNGSQPPEGKISSNLFKRKLGYVLFHNSNLNKKLADICTF
jgi:hypothetical protein